MQRTNVDRTSAFVVVHLYNRTRDESIAPPMAPATTRHIAGTARPLLLPAVRKPPKCGYLSCC